MRARCCWLLLRLTRLHCRKCTEKNIRICEVYGMQTAHTTSETYRLCLRQKAKSDLALYSHHTTIIP